MMSSIVIKPENLEQAGIVNSLKWKVKLLSLANNSYRLIFNSSILMTINFVKLRIHWAIEIRKEKINDGCT